MLGRIYLSISIRPFSPVRTERGWYAFIDRMREGSAVTIERRVLEARTRQEAIVKMRNFVKDYKTEHSYVAF